MKNIKITRLSFYSLLFLLLVSKILAGGSSERVRILSFTETSKDRYTMIVERLSADEMKKQLILRLRHNEYYFTKHPSKVYSLKHYREAIGRLKEFQQAKRAFPLGSMGGAWGIPVEGKNNEYWVQSLAVIKEHGGAKVVYTIKE